LRQKGRKRRASIGRIKAAAMDRGEIAIRSAAEIARFRAQCWDRGGPRGLCNRFHGRARLCRNGRVRLTLFAYDGIGK